MFKDIVGGIGLLGCLAILVLGLVFGGGAVYIVYLNTIGKATVNAQYQVTIHTQPYVQAHQATLLNYYADYVSGDAVHQAAAKLEICGEAALLDPVEYPSSVAPFIAQNCR